MFRLDLRSVDKDSLVEKLRVLQDQGNDVYTVANPDQSMNVFVVDHPKEPLVLTDKPLNPNSAQGMAQLDRTVTKSVVEINTKMSITGAKMLGEQFRNHLADIKKQLDAAANEMNGAMGELKDTTAQAQAMVKQVKDETADLKAALGLTSNGGPA